MWIFSTEVRTASPFSPAPFQSYDIRDTAEYYRLLCEQLAFALEKKPKDFRQYQLAVKAVDQARKRANGVLDRMQGDDRYAALRGVTIDALVTLVSSVTPSPVGKLLGSEKAKEVVNEGLKIGGELASQAYTKLRDELGNTFGDYLDAPLQLGLALGRDLHEFAKNSPILFLFDTYEEIDPGDTLLRVVMGAAGLRVGWILAGRDNLWGGLGQRKRSIAKEYGYKDIVTANRSLAVDFNVDGVGTFTLVDVQDYFDQLCKYAHSESALPNITEEEAAQIVQTTQGIPLAVSIAAALYRDTADVKLVIEEPDNQREIKALTRLGTNSQLREAASRTAWNVAYTLYKEKKASERIPFLNRAIELVPDYKQAYNSRSIAYGDLKEYKRTIEDCDQAIALDPKYVMAYNNRGNAYSDLKEHQRAIEDYNQAIALDPKYALAYNNRGIAYRSLKEYERAIEDYNQAIALDAKEAMAYNNRGNAYSDLKEYERAIEDHNQAIALDLKYAMAYNNRGNAYRGLEAYEQAIEDYNQAIVLDPKYATAYNNRGIAYRGLKRYENCLADLKQAFNLDETLNDTLNNWLGLAFSYTGQYAEAIIKYDKDLEVDPDNYTSLYNKAVAIARWKGLPIAQPDIEKACAVLRSPKTAQKEYAILYGNGGIEAVLGNTEKALDYLKRAVALDIEVADWARHDVAWLDLHSHPVFLNLIS